MVFQNEAQLRGGLAKPLQQAVDTVTKATLKEGENLIRSIVYVGSTWYPRTEQFLHAWINKVGGGSGIASGSYEYDPGKITTADPPVHAAVADARDGSFHRGDPSAGALADYIFVGHGGIWTGGGRNAFKKIEQWLKGSIVGLFKSGCVGAGLVVTKVGSYDVTGLQ